MPLTIGQAMSYLGPKKAKIDLLDQAGDVEEGDEYETEEEDEKGNKKRVKKKRKKKHPLEIDY